MKRSFWPYALILYFAVFITAVASWIVFAVRTDQQLVRKDYYAQELQFQKTIDSSDRAAATDVKVAYDSSRQTVSVNLPTNAIRGKLQFYRPSDAKLDRQVILNSKTETINVSAFELGLWKIQLTWVVDSLEYRREQTIVIKPRAAAQLPNESGAPGTSRSTLQFSILN